MILNSSTWYEITSMKRAGVLYFSHIPSTFGLLLNTQWHCELSQVCIWTRSFFIDYYVLIHEVLQPKSLLSCFCVLYYSIFFSQCFVNIPQAQHLLQLFVVEVEVLCFSCVDFLFFHLELFCCVVVSPHTVWPYSLLYVFVIWLWFFFFFSLRFFFFFFLIPSTLPCECLCKWVLFHYRMSFQT